VQKDGSPLSGFRGYIPPWLGPAVVYALSAACLIWVYRDFDWKSEVPRLMHMHWGWLMLAIACDIGVYICQAWRWNLLLRPFAKVPLWRTVRAIYIGLFANEALPLRSGEAIRIYLQSQWNHLPLSLTISSAVIERLMDGIWLMLGFGITTLFIDLPEKLVIGAQILTGMVVLLAILLAFAVIQKTGGRHIATGNRWTERLHLLIDGLHDIGRSPYLYYSFGASLVYMTLQIVPIYAIIRGYGEDSTIMEAAAVMVVLRLGTIVPGPPGNIGIFNFFALMGLTLVGIDRQTAIGLSGIMFFLITVPLLLAGTIALAATGLKLAEIQRHAHTHLKQARPPVSAK
jgi:uncharacterized protein (TIRG00374 family)